MKKIYEKLLGLALTISTAIMLLPVTAFAQGTSLKDDYKAGTGPDFDAVTSPIVDLIDSLLGPAIAIVGALGTVYCVILGAKFAKAEEPQEREKAKSHLKNAIIGFVLIFVLIVVLKGAIKPLTNWVNATK